MPAPTGPTKPADTYKVGAPGNPANWYSEPNPALLAKISETQKTNPTLAKLLLDAANQPSSNWLTKGVTGAQMKSYGDRALAAGKTPFYTLYARDAIDQHGDTKLYSSGAASAGQAAYMSKVKEWAAANGNRNAVFIIEPDAFMQSFRGSAADKQYIQQELADVGKTVRSMCPNATILLPVGSGAWGSAADVAAAAAPLLKTTVNGVPVFNGITVGEAGSTPNIGRDWGYPIIDALTRLGVPGMKVLEDSSRNGVNAVIGNGADPSNWANNLRRAAGPKAGPGTDPRSFGNVDIKTSELSDGRTSPAGSLVYDEWVTLIENAVKAHVPGWAA